jgi:Protein of unknown function (DUF3533)
MTKKLWSPYWHYPRASEKPLPRGPVSRRAFFKAALINFVFLQAVFLTLFAYIFGFLFQRAGHTHKIKILYIDYDGDGNRESAIGSDVSAAYPVNRRRGGREVALRNSVNLHYLRRLSTRNQRILSKDLHVCFCTVSPTCLPPKIPWLVFRLFEKMT